MKSCDLLSIYLPCNLPRPTMSRSRNQSPRSVPTLRVLQPQSPTASARGSPTLRVLRWHRRQQRQQHLQQESHVPELFQPEPEQQCQEEEQFQKRGRSRPHNWFMLLATSLFGCSALVLALILNSTS